MQRVVNDEWVDQVCLRCEDDCYSREKDEVGRAGESGCPTAVDVNKLCWALPGLL